MKTGTRHILVLEDERPLAEAIKTKLQLLGFEAIVVRTVKDAIDSIAKFGKPDAIWLDHYLIGVETGVDLVRYIRSDKKLKDISVFVVSNTASPDKIQEYLNLGAKKYYTKSNYRLDQIVVDIKESLLVS